MSETRPYKDWSDRKLKRQATKYHDRIHIDMTYTVSDVLIFDELRKELKTRGINVQRKLVFLS